MNLEDIQQPMNDSIDLLFVDSDLDPVMELTISVKDAKTISDFVISNKLASALN